MILDPSQMRLRDTYQLLISSVVPRPIAWISSLDPEGRPNLAPFSFFMGITSDPPLFAVSSNLRVRAGTKKDTLSNIEATGEFVINIVTEELAEQMNATSGEYDSGVNEFEVAGLTAAPSQKVRAPRVAESPVNIECRLYQILHLGREKALSGLIIGEGVLWHVRDDLLTPRNTVDVEKLHAIGRLSANYYTRTHDLFEMIRPVVE